MKRALCLSLIAALPAGCQSASKLDAAISREVEQDVREVDRRVKETRTLSSLAKLEDSIGDYHKNERRIPPTLESLIPKYLAGIPTVEIGARGHKDTAEVKAYRSDILRGGQIDGSKLRDTGRWGYVYNDRQVVVFIDCTHKSSRGRPWYQERGVY